MENSYNYLRKNIAEEGVKFFGGKEKHVNSLAKIWHDEKTSWHKNRWVPVEAFNDHKGKILDMSCGSGIFVFTGLAKGYDVYGVEPEEWKHTYFNMKIDEYDYPQEYKKRFIKAFGESLPFTDATFDYIESAQTLEHTNDYKKCLDELIRVLKPGGKIRIFAPDYTGYYEPHYRLPFLPKMNRNLAKLYLRLLRKPTIGLDTITYITGQEITDYLKTNYKNITIIDLYNTYRERRIDKVIKKVKTPRFIANIVTGAIWYNFFKTKGNKPINLVIKKG